MNLLWLMDHPSIRAEMTCIPLHKTWQMTLLWLMDPPGTRAEMTYISLHITWKMNLPWPMDPPGTRAEMTCIPPHKLGRWNYFGQCTPQYQSRDDLHTTTQNLADDPTLANGPPSTRSEMTCIPLHKTWQINLLWLNIMAKVWKL